MAYQGPDAHLFRVTVIPTSGLLQSPTMSPISRLTRELLLIIFTMIANMYDDWFILPIGDTRFRALTVVRRTTQVCSLWRKLILDNSRIWGRIIDVNLLLGPKTEYWRNEVLQRTRTAPLFIRGIVSSPYGEEEKKKFDKDVQKFFTKLFNFTNWERTEVLDLAVDNTAWFSEKTLEYIQRPHRRLRIFRLNILEDPPAGRTSLDPPNMIAFTKKAPRLVQLECMDVAINLQAHWFSNLRHFSLSYKNKSSHSHPFTLPDILNTLEQMPHLEGLNLRWASKYPTKVDMANIQPKLLPNLKKLGIEDDFSTCIAFLAKIKPPRECHFTLTTNDLTYSTDPRFVTGARTVIAHYAQNFFSANAISRIRLNLDDSGFIISTMDPRPASFESDRCFRIECALSNPPQEVSPLLKFFAETLSPTLSSSRITRLLLDSGGGGRVVSIEGLARFLGSLGSLQVLETTAEVVNRYLCPFFSKLVEGTKKNGRLPPPLCPNLRMVSILSFNLYGTPNRDAPAPNSAMRLLWLFKFREQLGLPIPLLDLTLCRSRLCPLECLEEVKGLSIIWRGPGGAQKVYVCGSGTANETVVI
ncbi:hypothetical protein NLJ89_g9093 [Agrocybe chaxingu]|uniref:F-box domain-containing protein n=1 Tax=Agrocybe chaxingu TaxID=84603 RepID=A0A9W8JTY8_9AGAR|nr:hypothetical protein NLJ89_g9093 [Agrocybe chaxingu]